MQVSERVFILRKVRYGDHDLILNCLNPAGAKIGLFARSALRSKKRFGGGVLEPTHFVEVIYENRGAQSEGQLHTLKEASLVNGFAGIRGDYARLEMALECVRLISDVAREGEIDSGELYNLLGNTLRAAESSTQLERLKTHFEVKLLTNQGVMAYEDEVRLLMAQPVSEHERIAISDEAWAQARLRVSLALQDYVQKIRVQPMSKV